MFKMGSHDPFGHLKHKLWPKEGSGVKSPISGISGLPLGSLGTKCHLDVSPVANHIVPYKGEGGGFPEVRAVVSLVSSCLFVVRSCTKSAIAMH
jgi:hypothetical protein